MDENNNIIFDSQEDNVTGINPDEGESTHSSHTHDGSHHSHHHHHHHSHHHSSGKRRKNQKLNKFIKRNKFKIANVFIAVLFVGILVVLGVLIDTNKHLSDKDSTDTSSGEILTEDVIQIEIPLFDEDVLIVGPAVKAYADADSSIQAVSIYNDYIALGQLDAGLPVTLYYNIKGMPAGCSVKGSKILVSENEDFSSSNVYSLSADETRADVYHLKTNTQYYYRIDISLSNGTQTSVSGSFKTADTPRFLSVDGVRNMRDIGGYKTVNGKTVRQGMLYRSTELDGKVEPKYAITPEGRDDMLSILGIRTDMDLRSAKDNPDGTDALGAGVKHNYYGAPMYGGAFTEEGKAAIRKVFADLADKNNYPVLMHCTHGMDRTGTVCYLLEAILGMSEEDMMKDYQFSSLCHGKLWGLNEMNEFIGRLKAYDGATMQEKAESYLISTGVTEAEIAAIREIFLEN